MKGKLAELEAEEKRLAARLRLGCERIGELVNPLLQDLGEMRIADAAGLMDDAVVQQAELLQVRGRIEDLKEALYG
jgi:hypothetical protein